MPNERIPLARELARQQVSPNLVCREPRNGDEEDLAILLYAAYRGTIDAAGETFDEARAEIEELLSGRYGKFLRDCSFVIEEGDFLVSACLVTWWPPHRAPLVAFTMTRPEARRRGLARGLIQRSINALLDRGENRLTLVVTNGNEAAQRLYESLGFRPMANA